MGANISCSTKIKPFINLNYASVLENEFKNRLIQQDFPLAISMFVKCRLFVVDYCSETESFGDTIGRLIQNPLIGSLRMTTFVNESLIKLTQKQGQSKLIS